MKKFILPFCALYSILMLFCCSCGLFGDQRYICEVEEVESIQIVRLDKYIEGEYRYEYTVLSEITELSVFIERLNNLNHSVNWGEPSQFDINYVVIKVSYLNRDFDLIYFNGQCFNRSGVNQYGYFFFDEEQFNTLISDYLND